MTFKEFTGKNVEEAIRTAMREFESDLAELDIEILSQGSRGILGVGGEDARILAAPKSAVAAAQTVRVTEAAEPEPEAGPSADAVETFAIGDAAGDQATDLARAEGNDRARDGGRTRGGRGGRERGERPGRGSREGRAPRATREPRADRPPREPREPREPAPFIPAKPLEELTDAERSAITGGQEVLTEL